MKHRTIEQIAKVARLAQPNDADDARWWVIRRRRLERLARLLDDHQGPLLLFSDMECYSKVERLALRQDASPLTVAFKDSQFRSQGLTGDSIGDAMRFFHLSMTEAHQLLCYCGYAETRRQSAPTSTMIAQHARSIAARRTFAELWEKAKAAIARWR
jgi:hypothetical protein